MTSRFKRHEKCNVTPLNGRKEGEKERKLVFLRRKFDFTSLGVLGGRKKVSHYSEKELERKMLSIMRDEMKIY